MINTKVRKFFIFVEILSILDYNFVFNFILVEIDSSDFLNSNGILLLLFRFSVIKNNAFNSMLMFRVVKEIIRPRFYIPILIFA